ncbi:MAG: GIY-YIG nuclease family protein [Erythrobacter sp.]
MRIWASSSFLRHYDEAQILLKSQPQICAIGADGGHRDLIHKIGVTGGQVETRIAGAEKSATYLLAGVEIVATYKLFNINRTQLESVIHKVFGSAALDLTIHDRFGNPVKPREWFLVPLNAIDEAVERIRDGSITNFRYDPSQAQIVPA